MLSYAEWAGRHPQAAAELAQVTTMAPAAEQPSFTDEAGAQQEARFQVARAGGLIWRNNVGATPKVVEAHCPKCQFKFEVHQRIIRYGLANDSAQLNDVFKSSDLIGVMPRLITQEMVGAVIGQFLAVECKHPGWNYTGAGRETGQQSYLSLVASKGGIAQFSTGDVYV